MRRRRTRGFTFVELLVVISLLAILVGAALDRLWKLQEVAEQAVFEQNLLALKLALRLRSAQLSAANRWDELKGLEKSNPFELLEEPPGTYLGENGEVRGNGVWYFDARQREVVYVARSREGVLSNDKPLVMRFAVVPAGGDGYSVTLKPRANYVWNGQTVR